MAWELTSDVEKFASAAGEFLRSDSVRNTIFLTAADNLRSRGPHAYGPTDPVLGWWTTPDGVVAGALLQTPPHPVMFSEMPAEAVPAAVRVLADRPILGVNMLAEDVDAFVTGLAAGGQLPKQDGMRTRLYRLGALTPPDPAPPGAARFATAADRDLLIEWLDAFFEYIGGPQVEAGDAADDHLAHSGITLWTVDGVPVSMAVRSRPHAGMVRILHVWTPPALRGHGYAGAVTTAATAAALNDGATEVVLNADLANPTSNALYQRLGYQPVEDRAEVWFPAFAASVNVGSSEPSMGKDVPTTGIRKKPVSAPVPVRAPGLKSTGLHSGVVGDHIGDTKHHGGNDQAVYAYAREDYAWWSAELGRDLPPGIFGENLTTSGLDLVGAVIGEKWEFGSGLVLQVTFGRIPCVTFQNRMGEPRWVKRFARANRTGAYLRVVTPGSLIPGDRISVVDRPAHGLTVAESFEIYMHDPARLARLLVAPELPPELLAEVSERVAGSE
ncbi:MOSC domain-containing protein YiiM [Actinoplanes regularis]|uniref:MOSC domain-containing protein YiiM n=2 Tax=Actinoplanes regularis TaxID=52697 RepID=A0A238XAF6_9ACTN|nr:hypothetical protein Are01nite_30450 [Actinoplanes regularis]SNR55334.1 MOSC domain-containing protein YiiM [Actinoplanes regularis]